MKPHLFLLLWPVILIACWRKERMAGAGGIWRRAGGGSRRSFVFRCSHLDGLFCGDTREHIDQQYLANLSFLLRFMVPGHPVWVQMVPSALGIAFCCRYYWRRRNVWYWRADGAALLLISTMVSPYSWPFDQLLLLPAIIHVCSARRSAKAVPALAVANGGGGAVAVDDDSAEFAGLCMERDGVFDLVCVGAEEGGAGGGSRGADRVGDGVGLQPSRARFARRPHLPTSGRAIRLPFDALRLLRVAQARLWGTRLCFTTRSDFEDDGHDEGAAGSIFLDVAFEVDADFFLDDAVVGFFFRAGGVEGLGDNGARRLP